MLLCCCRRFSRAARSVLPLSPNSFSKTAARIPLHRQGLRGAAPGERVEIGAAQIAGAGARVGRQSPCDISSDASCVSLAKCRPSSWSIETSAMISISLLPAARSAGEKRSGSARVDIVPTRLDAREHQHLIAVRGQRLQDRRQFESAVPSPFRSPILHRHSVGHVKRLEPRAQASPRRAEAGASLRERQRQRGAETLQYRSTRAELSSACLIPQSTFRSPALPPLPLAAAVPASGTRGF